MTQTLRDHIGTCAVCGWEQTGVHYVREPLSDLPCWVCDECEMAYATERVADGLWVPGLEKRAWAHRVKAWERESRHVCAVHA